jgi:hypothetical protein
MQQNKAQMHGHVCLSDKSATTLILADLQEKKNRAPRGKTTSARAPFF